jgi:hypothetical protein
MTKTPAPYNLAPAGYLIVQDSKQARFTNDYRKAFGPYFGVDRLPPFIAPEPEIRKQLGMPPVQDMRLYAALNEWFDIQSGSSAFIPNRTQALRLFKALQGYGFQLELVYCQLAWTEGEAERLNAYTGAEEKPPVVSLTYGFDISWPSCNHSAILQPGIVPSSLRWRQKLNPHGLLNNFEDAAQLRAEYIAVYPYPPFDIYLVHKVGEHE